MEIVSVKELADGSLHFSFRGIPNCKVNELSSFHGEHAGKLAISKRLPSRFRKQSPIPVLAARRKKKQEESQSIHDASTPSNTEGVVKPSSRPKSSFLKRSPIPKRKNVLPRLSKTEVVHLTNAVVNHPLNSSLFKEKPNERPSKVKKGHFSQNGEFKKEVKTLGQSPTRFVRKSPVPTRAAASRQDARHPPLLEPDLSPNTAPGSHAKPLGKHAAAQPPRPKSRFTRRSPITPVDKQAAQKITPTESLQKPSNEALKLDVSSQTDLPIIAKVNSSRDELACGLSGKLRGQFLGHEGFRSLEVRSQNNLASVAKENENTGDTMESGKSLDLETETENPVDFVASSDLRKYKLAELKSIAKSRGLKGYSKLKKEELLKLLSNKE